MRKKLLIGLLLASLASLAFLQSCDTNNHNSTQPAAVPTPTPTATP